MDSEVPPERIRTVCTGEGEGPVVYWSTMARRTNQNPALQHAAEEAKRRGVGVWMLEALRCDYPHASERFHRFIQQGMADNQKSCKAMGIGYHGHIELNAGESKGLLAHVAKQSSLVVTDDHPGFFIPKMLASVNVNCRVDGVDGNGLLPQSQVPRPFSMAVHFRRHLQKTLPQNWWFPARDLSIDGADVPKDVQERWPHNPSQPLDELPIDHAVHAVATPGGSEAARTRFAEFDVDHYLRANHPDENATSGLSPYLHFGHIGVHEIVQSLLESEGWNPTRWGTANGARAGWWGASEPVEAFLDQIVTWRELGFVDRHQRPDNHRYESLPEWARITMESHAGDARTVLDDGTLESAATDDSVWNAAQRELTETGVIHNYLRMLWGKRILEWSASPKQAFERMLHLNDKWALDGRDPNSISGIAWVLGRFDRAWAERDVYGKVRYMSSANTVRKLRMKQYLDRFGAASESSAGE